MSRDCPRCNARDGCPRCNPPMPNAAQLDTASAALTLVPLLHEAGWELLGLSLDTDEDDEDGEAWRESPPRLYLRLRRLT